MCIDRFVKQQQVEADKASMSNRRNRPTYTCKINTLTITNFSFLYNMYMTVIFIHTHTHTHTQVKYAHIMDMI